MQNLNKNAGLLLAVLSNNLTIAKYLVDSGADANYRFNALGFSTMLHAIAHTGSVDMAQLFSLYDFNGIDLINSRARGSDGCGVTAFLICCLRGNVAMLDYLFKKYDNINIFTTTENGTHGLIRAIFSQSLEMVKYCLQVVYSENIDLIINRMHLKARITPLTIAGRENSNYGIEVMKLLLHHGADPYIMRDQARGLSTLHLLCSWNKTKSVTFLLENKIYTNIHVKSLRSDKSTPLQLCLGRNKMNMVKILCKYCKQDKKNIGIALKHAASRYCGNLNRLKLVLQWLLEKESVDSKSKFIDAEMFEEIKNHQGTNPQCDILLTQIIKIFENSSHTIRDIINAITTNVDFNNDTKTNDEYAEMTEIIKCDKGHQLKKLETNTKIFAHCFMCKHQSSSYTYTCNNGSCDSFLCSDCQQVCNRAWKIECLAKQMHALNYNLFNPPPREQIDGFWKEIQIVIDDDNRLLISIV